jgi:hypothetical protein
LESGEYCGLHRTSAPAHGNWEAFIAFSHEMLLEIIAISDKACIIFRIRFGMCHLTGPLIQKCCDDWKIKYQPIQIPFQSSCRIDCFIYSIIM